MPLGPVVASLRAPIVEQTGFAWFPPGSSSTEADQTAMADASARAVLGWLDTVKATSIGLLGFSQGGAMALQLMRLAPERFACAVQLSGFVLPGDQAGDAELAENRPPVFWGRGTADAVISPELIERTERWLAAHATATSNIYEDVAHAISEQELSDVGAFLRDTPPLTGGAGRRRWPIVTMRRFVIDAPGTAVAALTNRRSSAAKLASLDTMTVARGRIDG